MAKINVLFNFGILENIIFFAPSKEKILERQW
jgi:hypothetical protein